MDRDREALVDEEVKEMLLKGAIQETSPCKGEFISNVFLVSKKEGGNRPVINLKALNQFLPYEHFKMEGLHNLKDLIEQDDYFCKIDLKDAYFSIPLAQKSQKYVRFIWKEKLYEFVCLCFGLSLAPRIFYKITESAHCLAEKAQYKSDNLLGRPAHYGGHKGGIDSSKRHSDLSHATPRICIKSEEVCAVSYPGDNISGTHSELTGIDFVIDFRKSGENSRTYCRKHLREKETTVLDLTKIIGLLSSAAQAVMPARLQFRFLQNQLIQSMKGRSSFQTKIILSKEALGELEWWVNNLLFYNGRQVIQRRSQVLVQTDASKKGWGASCQGIRTGGPWSSQEESLHINHQELIAINYGIKAIHRVKGSLAYHIQVDNTTALAYLVKMGGSKSLEMTKVSKEIWSYLLQEGITITAEYLPMLQNNIN